MIKDSPKGLPDSALDFKREIPKATLTKEDQDAVDTQDIIRYMENKYPEMTQEFRTIQKEQYELFLRKQHDYGPQNVAVGSLLKTKEDIKLSLLGLWFRIQDKTERIKTLLMREDGNSVQDEPVVDSYNDISVYGIMAQVVARGKWAK